MKTYILLISLFLTVSCQAQEPKDKEQDIVFHSVSVIPMDSERVLENQVVVIRNGKIAAMGDASSVRYGKNAMVIDGKGKFLIPGLAEMHAHVPPVNDLAPMKDVLLLFASRGITTIRGMLGHPKHLELREMIRSGEVTGPRFYTSGPSFNGNSVKSPQQGAEMVRQQKQAGYDFLKLHPGLTKENFAAIASTAKEVGIGFAGHVSFDVGVWRAIDAGYATIDHLDGFVESLVPGIESIGEQNTGLFGMFVGSQADPAGINKLTGALKDKHIWVVPTQALAERWMSPIDAGVFDNAPEMKYMAANTRSQWMNSKNNILNNPKYNADEVNRFIQLRRKIILECNKAGVGLLLGSDAPQVFNVPGFSTHQELKYMVDAGLTPYEALRTGTANVGRFFNIDVGIIKAGAIADLILLNGNPLKDIDQTNNIEGVMLDGRWLSKEWIERTLKSLEK